MKQQTISSAEYRRRYGKGRGVGSTPRGEMNKTEAEYAALYLEPLKLSNEYAAYWYECFKLRLASGAWFTVDFVCLRHNNSLEFHEVKGHWREAAKVRIKVAAELYPFRFISAQKLPKKQGWKIVEYRGAVK